jgi:hypothetical protein
MVRKIFGKFFGPKKRGLKLKTQKNFCLNFIFEFLGHFVLWYLTRRKKFFLQIFGINIPTLIFLIQIALSRCKN